MDKCEEFLGEINDERTPEMVRSILTRIISTNALKLLKKMERQAVNLVGFCFFRPVY